MRRGEHSSDGHRETTGVLRVAGAQITNRVGDLEENAEEIRDAMRWAEEQEADVLVLPELALTGYPLEDLANRGEFVDAAMKALEELAREAGSLTTIVGCLDRVLPTRSWDTQERNTAISSALICDGEIRGIYHKVLLPTYEVFDEARNFAAGRRPDALWRIGGVVTGVSICEDLWSGDGPPEAQAAAGARILFAPNASPFQRGKTARRLGLVSTVARRTGLPIVYVNCVGGQDSLVFDGGSIVVDADGELLYRAPQFEAVRFCLDVTVAEPRPLEVTPTTVHARVSSPRTAEPAPMIAPEGSEEEQVWTALVVGTRDFVDKLGLDGVVLGLSGGIDSAVTAAVAAEALGPDSVLAVAMPSSETQEAELTRARLVAERLGIELREVSLAPVLDAFGGALQNAGAEVGWHGSWGALDRARATVMATFAEDGHLLPLSTTNKSELSIGARFGGLFGGFAPLSDCPKTLVYALARLRHVDDQTIPDEVISERSTAQRSPDIDLPPYRELDEIVERYVEFGEGVDEIVARGFEEATVRGVLQLVDDAELTRRRSAPGVKITARAFGKDRRMPIANAWRPFRAEQAELAGGGEEEMTTREQAIRAVARQ